MLRPPGNQHLGVHRVIERVQRVEALVLRVKYTPPHHRVEAPQGGDQQMQAIRADRRPVAGLDEPAFNSTLLERASSFEQEQPRVFTNRFRSSVPRITVFGQEAEPGPQHSQIRVARPRCANTPHEAIPLVERNDELTVSIEDQPLVERSTEREGEVGREPQRTRAVQAAELASRASLSAHDGGSGNAASHHT